MADRYVSSVGIVTAAVILSLVAFWLFRSGPAQTPPAPDVGLSQSSADETGTAPGSTSLVVSHVVDGDTLVLSNGDTVRLIGVDTPETKHPELPVQRFAEEATAFLTRMAEGMKVRLEYDRDRQDVYGRTLAYVFVGDRLVNLELIRRGYGYAYTRFPHRRMNEFIAAEREARSRQYGMWNYSLSDARITNLIDRFERLSPEGKRALEEAWDGLLEQYPAPETTEEEGHGSN